MKTPAVLNTKEGQWVVLGLVVVAVGYFLVRKVGQAAGAAVDAGAGLISGDNAITANQHDWSGAPTNAYVGTGVAGTLGAVANSASGGGLASIGESIGGWLYDTFHPYNPNADTTAQATQGVTRSQIVTPNYVSDVGQLF